MWESEGTNLRTCTTYTTVTYIYTHGEEVYAPHRTAPFSIPGGLIQFFPSSVVQAHCNRHATQAPAAFLLGDHALHTDNSSFDDCEIADYETI